MSTLKHNGLTVNYGTNNIGNTSIYVYLTKEVCVNAVRDAQGEIYSVILDYSTTEDSLWFGAFGPELPNSAEAQVAPWLPLLQPIFAKIPLATE